MQRKLQRQTFTRNTVRTHKPQSLKRLLIISERLLSTDKNVFSQWAEMWGRGRALIQTQGGQIAGAQNMSQETQPLARSVGLGSARAQM